MTAVLVDTSVILDVATRDPRRIKSYFPTVQVIAPDS